MYAVLFRENGLHKVLKFNQKLLEFFSRKSPFCVFLDPILKPAIFGAGIFMYNGHQIMIDKFLNTECE
jgi:hypothetical protein